MTTARELLEQVDALMRRNRQPEPMSPDGATTAPDDSHLGSEVAPAAPYGSAPPARVAAQSEAEDIPVLTDVADVDEPMVIEDELAGELERDIQRSRLSDAAEPGRDDVPLLTDAVDESEAAAALGWDQGAPAAAAMNASEAVPAHADRPPESRIGWEPSARLAASEAPAAGADRGRDAYDIHAAPEHAEASDRALAEAASDAQSRLAEDDPRWDALAEEIRVQVLQRLDLFTDSGLQSQLREHLQPTVDRASAELVSTINREVGGLVRTYVAQAIEREIEKWRREVH